MMKTTKKLKRQRDNRKKKELFEEHGVGRLGTELIDLPPTAVVVMEMERLLKQTEYQRMLLRALERLGVDIEAPVRTAMRSYGISAGLWKSTPEAGKKVWLEKWLRDTFSPTQERLRGEAMANEVKKRMAKAV